MIATSQVIAVLLEGSGWQTVRPESFEYDLPNADHFGFVRRDGERRPHPSERVQQLTYIVNESGVRVYAPCNALRGVQVEDPDNPGEPMVIASYWVDPPVPTPTTTEVVQRKRWRQR